MSQVSGAGRAGFAPRRLAALDMYGTKGTRRRRRLVLTEFILGVGGCAVLGLASLAHGGPGAIALGVWLLGAALNYVPLAAHAVALSRPGALECELEAADVRRELRTATLLQLWILVPGAVLLFELRERGARRTA